MRKAYIDNIRWAAVWLVLIYHVCYMFNGVGILGGIPGAENIPAFDTAAAMVYPWFMVLLFLLAGMSARYSLCKRTGGQFIRERTVKLLVPSTLGLFVIHWVTGYLNIKMGGGLEYIPAPLVYPISAISGIGPLWFIQTLFLFSCVLVFIKKLDRGDRLLKLCGKCGLPIIILLVLPVFGAAQVLNMPVLTMYRFGIYFVAFLIGYFVFSHDGVQDKIERARVPMLCASVICAVVYAVFYNGTDYTSPKCGDKYVPMVHGAGHYWLCEKVYGQGDGLYPLYVKLQLRSIYPALPYTAGSLLCAVHILQASGHMQLSAGACDRGSPDAAGV